MDEERVSVSKFKAECLGLLRQVNETGKPLLVTKRGKPLARIEPPEEAAPRRLGTLKGKVRILGDIMSPASDTEDWEVLK